MLYFLRRPTTAFADRIARASSPVFFRTLLATSENCRWAVGVSAFFVNRLASAGFQGINHFFFFLSCIFSRASSFGLSFLSFFMFKLAFRFLPHHRDQQQLTDLEIALAFRAPANDPIHMPDEPS